MKKLSPQMITALHRMKSVCLPTRANIAKRGKKSKAEEDAKNVCRRCGKRRRNSRAPTILLEEQEEDAESRT